MKDPGVNTGATGSSFPRKRESRVFVRRLTWIPAFAGMTEEGGCVVGETKRLFQTTDHDRGALLRIFHCVAVAALLFVAAGCDPVVNIGGTFFPGWMVSILIGSA